MRKYVIFGKYSSDFYTAMLNKPKNRLEFVKPILNTSGLTARRAYNYLKNRNISDDDMLKYNLGYFLYDLEN